MDRRKGWIAEYANADGSKTFCFSLLRVKIEQRINLKFLVKLNKTASESFQTITENYGEECVLRTRAFEWYKRFFEGRTDVKDDERSGRPSTSKITENIQKIKKILRENCRLSI